MLKQNGDTINREADKDGPVAGCCLFPQAIWENVSVFLNGIQIR